ncbi:MAG: hypothetical protein JWR80_6383 [Bradyrhizobium sp.]|nr:hypothetical protein [Bradyrhizobium sp.]
MQNRDIQTLNELIKISIDGEMGFQKAATEVRNEEVRRALLDSGRHCGRGAERLKQRVIELGGTPVESGSLPSVLHRGWISMKAAVTGHADLSILAACETGEEMALKAFFSALEDVGLTPPVRRLIEEQYKGVAKNYEKVQKLRNFYANAPFNDVPQQ